MRRACLPSPTRTAPRSRNTGKHHGAAGRTGGASDLNQAGVKRTLGHRGPSRAARQRRACPERPQRLSCDFRQALPRNARQAAAWRNPAFRGAASFSHAARREVIPWILVPGAARSGDCCVSTRRARGLAPRPRNIVTRAVWQPPVMRRHPSPVHQPADPQRVRAWILPQKAIRPSGGARQDWCPGRGSNPHGSLEPTDFKSVASASFATRADALARRRSGTLSVA